MPGGESPDACTLRCRCSLCGGLTWGKALRHPSISWSGLIAQHIATPLRAYIRSGMSQALVQ
eukprot:384649-Amphidinium_carterae.1